jgi:hypothetical protein
MSNDMSNGTLHELNRQTREIWDRTAPFWDERMGEGNQFQRVLVGPASERLLEVQPGQVFHLSFGLAVHHSEHPPIY